MGSYFRDYLSPKATERPTIGDTKFSVINQDHMGWLKCDGRLVSKADFALLFRVIGNSFDPLNEGTDTLFKLPDMRSRVPGAVGQGTGLSNRELGDSVGEETHTLTIAEMPSHNHGTNASDTVVGNNLTGLEGGHDHDYNDSGHQHNIKHGYDNKDFSNAINQMTPGDGNSNVVFGYPTEKEYTGITFNAAPNHQHSIATQGGDDPHNNMQPTLFIGNMFIYTGRLFPKSKYMSWRFENNTNIL